MYWQTGGLSDTLTAWLVHNISVDYDDRTLDNILEFETSIKPFTNII